MLHVACVRQGEAFGVEYVERLFDMVRRNLPDGFSGRFVCLTDRPDDLKEFGGICTTNQAETLPGWWAKMQLFDPAMQATLGFEKGDRIWYFDLDTVIAGPLDKLFEYPGAFGILEDVYRPGGFQSSVMSWIAGTALTCSIWEEWAKRKQPRSPGGDQQVLEQFWKGPPGIDPANGLEFGWLHARIGGAPWPPDFLQQLYPGSLRSYKVDCVWGVPKGTSVVFFHGRPRPHEVLTGWVPELWKVGAANSAQIFEVGTVDQTKVVANIADALTHDYANLAQSEPHEKCAIICGGGPSLADHLPMIGAMQRGGALVFSCNNVDGFLRDRGISPNFHVMMDARELHAEWVYEGGIKLYASMCNPKTLAAGAELGDLTIWHPLTQGVETVIDRKALLVGGGSTVGTRAMALAYVMGFRRLMCFGFDSSYRDGNHHAYGQAVNDTDRALDCVVGGKRFKAAPWMVKQADDWKELAQALMGLGCEISVTGDGLIAAVVAGMNSATVEIDGFEWPSQDTQARQSILGSLPDLEKYIGLCTHRRVAVQAGGNVGVWPKELSKHFADVYTFEPDALNYGCLARNVREPNVFMRFAALGELEGLGAIARDPQNCGASAVAQGSEFPVITLDSLELAHVDLLQLDVEGFELQALKGAAATIARCSPLIVLELKGLGERYGYTDDQVDAWLKELSYQRIGVAHRDVIYKRVM
jgi:FkbM family methyltransferase